MADEAPIVFFAYRRPEHAERCLAALAANPQAPRTDLIAFVDGPKSESEKSIVEKTRQVLHSASGFASVRVVARPKNVGLAGNVSQGLTAILGERERAIVVEDDLEVSPAFLAYMNDGLQLYADEEKVASVHGYVYPTGRPLPASFFLRGADCWGWGTWVRAWKHYNPDAVALGARLRRCAWRNEFDFDGAYPYRRMLDDAASGRVDSWAIRWYASAFLDGMYTLYPGVSLVWNKGHDGTGTHGSATGRYDTSMSATSPILERLTPCTDQTAYKAFHDYFLSLKPPLGTRVLRRLRDTVIARQKKDKCHPKSV